ncbi:MAG: hypothetical protein K9I85_11480 [Saprospiraceae bacterium]|nr:hypothetical protein [Saprospiraceae bacterium]
MDILKSFYLTHKTRIHKVVRNRYFLVAVGFLIYVIFFDHSRLISQWQLERDIQKLEQDKTKYQSQIEEIRGEQLEIGKDKERYAREHYYMKRADEDVYIVED